jgi:uncharacterized protein YkwD
MPTDAVAAASSWTLAQQGRDVQMRLATAVSVMLALGVLVSFVPAAFAAPGQPAATVETSNVRVSAYCASSSELALLKLINDYRRANGRRPLALSQTLGAAAEHHSKSMADHNYFSHTLLSQGISWSQNMTNHGYDYSTYRGENIAAGMSSAQRVFDSWKASPAHRASMLSSNFKAIGIGRVYNAASTYDNYWTTDFGGVADRAAAVCG